MNVLFPAPNIGNVHFYEFALIPCILVDFLCAVLVDSCALVDFRLLSALTLVRFR